MDIAKGLYAAPTGLEEEMAPALEIEIEDPEEVRIGIDGMEIDLKPAPETDDDFDANLAEYIDESALQGMAEDLVAEFEKDISDRKDWIQTYVDGLKLLGNMRALQRDRFCTVDKHRRHRILP